MKSTRIIGLEGLFILTIITTSCKENRTADSQANQTLDSNSEPTGLIGFSTTRDGNYEVYVMEASGANVKNPPRILLMPDQGKMHCNVLIKENDKKEIFALTIPETIGSREGMILNFPSTNTDWTGPDSMGIVSTSWTTDSLIRYSLILKPGFDFVNVEMTIANLSGNDWRDVWSFNCLNPVRADQYKDALLQRTYLSSQEGPLLLSETRRIKGPRPAIGVYFHEQTENPESFPFIEEFQATSPDRTNGNYLVTLSETGDSYMAATSPNALFLFNNSKFKCIHSAPNFGDISKGQSKTVTCRFYFADGDLKDFLSRYRNEVL